MITSASNGRIKWVAAIIEKSKFRKKEGKFVAEGCKMFLEAPGEQIAEVFVSESFLEHAKQAGSLEAQCLSKLEKIGYETVADDVYKKMSDTVTPQGILTVLFVKEMQLSAMLTSERPLLLLLENIQDPGNLGTIVRTAEGAGVSGILLSRDSVDIYNPKVIRSTMGSVYRVPFLYVDDFKALTVTLKEKGVRIFAAALGSDKLYDECSYEGATAFLVGNEGNGLRPETILLADECCILPMEGEVESLNASVAASILMYEAYRQRRKKLCRRQ